MTMRVRMTLEHRAFPLNSVPILRSSNFQFYLS